MLRFRPALAKTTWILAGAAMLWSAPATSRVDSERYLEHIKYLASEQLKGRGTGTPELEQASHYIARQLQAFGLQPPDGKSFLQAFPVAANARLGTRNHFEFTSNGERVRLKTQEDFVPFNFSDNGKASGQVVFVGYGISAPEYGYDDYAGIDVKEKLVLMLRHEPQEFDEKSIFAGRNYTQHSQYFSKAVNAKLHGAKGVLLVSDFPSHAGSDSLEKFAHSMGPSGAGLAFVQVKWETVEKWVAAAGQDLRSVVSQIDKDLKPHSFALQPGLTVQTRVDINRDRKTVHNVAGYLPGETSEYVIVGAHYDHIGLGELFSMAPDGPGHIHPGADDNASGTAGLLELARFYSVLARSQHSKPRRGILFLAFAGEELGLLGSGYYVNYPRLPLQNAVAMLNLDMIGRVREHKVFIGDADSGSSFQAILGKLIPRSGLAIDTSDTIGYGASDHASFTTRQIPTLFFFSGLHSDYHRPTDTWDKIEASESVRLLDLISDIADVLITGDRPRFVRKERAEAKKQARRVNDYYVSVD